jgi:hypothetical protein
MHLATYIVAWFLSCDGAILKIWGEGNMQYETQKS